jgi:prefoldin subunit 5
MNTDEKNLEALRQAVEEVVREELVEKLRPQIEAVQEAREKLREVKDRLKEVKETKGEAASNSSIHLSKRP